MLYNELCVSYIDNKAMSTNSLQPATTYPIVVGKVLHYLRRQKNLEQAALARAVGVTQSTWSRIENGQSALSVEQLAHAASLLDVRPEQILAMVGRSVQNLERQGVRVELRRPAEGVSPGLVFIGAAALTALLAAILSKSK